MLTSQGRDGYPHTVPSVTFEMVIEFSWVVGTILKVKNIERNPKVSLVIEDGKTMSDLRVFCLEVMLRLLERMKKD